MGMENVVDGTQRKATTKEAKKIASGATLESGESVKKVKAMTTFSISFEDTHLNKIQAAAESMGLKRNAFLRYAALKISDEVLKST